VREGLELGCRDEAQLKPRRCGRVSPSDFLSLLPPCNLLKQQRFLCCGPGLHLSSPVPGTFCWACSRAGTSVGVGLAIFCSSNVKCWVRSWFILLWHPLLLSRLRAVAAPAPRSLHGAKAGACKLFTME